MRSRIRSASALRCPWLVIGLLPPAESIRISDHTTPVAICTEATCGMEMLSSLLPKILDLTRLTRNGPTTILVGKKKFPLVKRLAVKVSVCEEIGSVMDFRVCGPAPYKLR